MEIRGVLRDFKGDILCIFSFSIRTQDSNSVELLTVHRACVICDSYKLLRDRMVEIVSDSSVVVNWITGGDIGSVSHVDSIYDIREIMSARGNLSVGYNPITTNVLADLLAKNGSKKRGD